MVGPLSAAYLLYWGLIALQGRLQDTLFDSLAAYRATTRRIASTLLVIGPLFAAYLLEWGLVALQGLLEHTLFDSLSAAKAAVCRVVSPASLLFYQA